MGDVLYQRKVNTSWLAAPHWYRTFSSAQRFRMAFTVANGEGPIGTGDLELYRKRPGMAWEATGWYAKFAVPGYSFIDQGEPIVVPPTWYEIDPIIDPPGEDTQWRVHCDYEGSTYYSPIIVADVRYDVVAGTIEQLAETDFTVEAVHELTTFRGIFQDRGTVQLGVEGRTPELICESAVVACIEEGDGLIVDGTGYTMRGNKRQPDGLSILHLEEMEGD